MCLFFNSLYNKYQNTWKWKKIRARQVDEFTRIKAIIDDPGIPLDSLVIYTSSPESVKYFQDILEEVGCRGKVLNVITK